MMILAFCLGGNLLAAEPEAIPPTIDPKPISLKFLILQAQEKNPRLQGVRLREKKSFAAVEEAGSWKPAQLTVTEFLEPIQTRQGDQLRAYNLTQPLPFPGATGLLSDAAGEAAQAMSEKRNWAERNLTAQVKAVYFDLWQLQGTPELVEQNESVALHITTLGGRERKLSKLKEVLAAQAQLGENGKLLFDLEQRALASRYHLGQLLGSNQPWAGKIEEPRLPQMSLKLEELLIKARKQYPPLKAQEHRLKSAESRSSYQTAKAWLPEWSIGVSYIDIDPADTGAEGKNAQSVTLGMTLPFGNSGLHAKKAQARLQEEVERLNLVDMQNRLESEVASSYSKVRQAYRLVELYDNDLLPPARQQTRLANRLFGSGRGGAIEALSAQAQLIALQVAQIKAKSDYLKALVQLELLTGLELTEAE